jgi:hypothetical protein
MKCARAAWLAPLVLAASVGQAALGCEPALEGAAGRMESDRFVARFRLEPANVEVGDPFHVALALCGKAGAPVPSFPEIVVDAHMPDHRHGMNYKPEVKALGGGRYVAEGFVFHMSGRWEIVVEVRAGGRTDRLAAMVQLE